MKLQYILFALLCTAIFTSSCASKKMAKQLTYHNSQLAQLAERNMDAGEKVDVLAALMIEALEESLQFQNPKNTVKFLKRYTKQNKASINSIYNEIEAWYSPMSPTSKLVATARIGTKPYVRQLLNLVPKVESKINRKLKAVFFLSRFTSLLGL